MATNDDGADSAGPVPGEQVRHATGVHSNRAFPTNAHPAHLDPFVLFERFYIEPDDGFPMHEHRGFEIVSYMLEGGMDHADSLGVEHTADANDAMHITTGNGIRHSEFPANGAACNGLQLWVNLPRASKETDPDYEDASSEELPTTETDRATVTTVVGDDSPLDTITEMEYLDVEVADAWTWAIPDDWAGFLYGVAGAGTVDGYDFGEGEFYPVTAADDADVEGAIDIRSADSLRLVAVSGRPHDEPIQQRGPYVL